MAYRTKLQQVGTEGFYLLDETEHHKTHYNRYQPRSNLTCVYSPNEIVINSLQAAQKYKGIMFCEHQAKKLSSYVYNPHARDETIDSSQAAHKYNHVMICERQENKPPMATMKKVQNYRNHWSFM
uniref:Uncharacterized protein n=1 Tax=Opuntia streptacantha TaxID=393608 RepID=A0A7C9DM70_OPUST